MIQSMFILTTAGYVRIAAHLSPLLPRLNLYLCAFYYSEVIIEKRWRGLTSRNVCDFFMEEVNKYREREDVPPIITTSKCYLVSTFRDDLFVLAVVTNEVRPTHERAKQNTSCFSWADNL